MGERRHRIDPDGRRLPVKLDTTSNGEFLPVPLSRANREANRRAQAAADTNAKRLGMGRRDFLLWTCGAASTLLAFNAANAAAGRTGGLFDLPAVAATEPAAAVALESGEFIFDVQGHFVNPTGAWLKRDELSAIIEICAVVMAAVLRWSAAGASPLLV